MQASQSEKSDQSNLFLNYPSIFSLGFLMPLYLFLQYMLAPLLFFFANAIGINIPFLERFLDLEGYSDAVFLATIGTISLTFAFFLFPVHNYKKALEVDWNLKKSVNISMIFFFSNILYRAFKYSFGSGEYQEVHYNNLIGPLWVGIILFPSKFQLYAGLVALISYFSADISTRYILKKRVAFVLIVLIGTGLITRSRTAIFAPLLCISFVITLMGEKRHKKMLAYFLLTSVPLVLVVKNYVRSSADIDNEATNLFVGLAEVLQRISMLDSLTAVVGYFKHPVWGESIPVMFINSLEVLPSAIKDWALSGDPAYMGGNEFGRMFGLIGPYDDKTGVALPMIGDLYLNFGLLGVICGLALFGCFAKLLQYKAVMQPTCSRVLLLTSCLPLLVSGHEHQIGVFLAEFLRILIFYLLVRMFVLIPAKKNSIVK